jgi:HAD superfamily hydrolase (TIGR01509 family)
LIRDENMNKMSPKLAENIQNEVFNAIEECEKESISLCELMPGCDPTLQWFLDRGIKMGIATSNSEDVANGILKIKGLDHYFSSVIGRRPELKMKPSPDQLLKCLDEMGVSPKFSIMVGDSLKDVHAAKAANMYFVAIPAFFTRIEALKNAEADIIINSLEELPNIIPEAALVKVKD